MIIYVASSWRNDLQPDVVATLRNDGHEVYDFKNPAPGDNGFGWRQLELGEKSEWDANFFATKVLDHPVAARGFNLDMRALEACSACVLVLPCGRSAHLELGYAVGAGKLTIVYMPKLEEPELMYRMCDYVETTLDGVRRALSKQRLRPRWQRDLVVHDSKHTSQFGNADNFYGMQYTNDKVPCARRARADGSGIYDPSGKYLGGARGPCREYQHRECQTCKGCWRHGACSCSPDLREFA